LSSCARFSAWLNRAPEICALRSPEMWLIWAKPSGYSSAMKAVVISALAEARMVHHGRQERQIVADALDLEGVERFRHRLHRLVRVGAQVHSLAIIGS
jgi:hypothetical protein